MSAHHSFRHRRYTIRIRYRSLITHFSSTEDKKKTMAATNTALFLFALMVALLLGATTTEAFLAPTPLVVKATPQSSSSSPSALSMTILTYGNKKKDFPPGSPLSRACAQLGVQVKYSCKKGDCATCQVTLAGRYTKPCVAKVPEEPRLKSLKEKGLEIRN